MSILPVEISIEHYMGLGGLRKKQLQEIKAKFLVGRAVGLSLGGVDEPDPLYLRELKNFVKEHEIKSLHVALGFCIHQGIYLGRSFALPHSPQTRRLIVSRVLGLKEYLECPIALENLSHQGLGLSQFTDSLDFLNEVSEQCQTSLLLNLKNLRQTLLEYGQSLNLTDLEKLPLHGVVIDNIADYRELNESLKQVPVLLRGQGFERDFIEKEALRFLALNEETYLEPQS
jgi:uncharacterized protein (UPF0276 family)